MPKLRPLDLRQIKLLDHPVHAQVLPAPAISKLVLLGPTSAEAEDFEALLILFPHMSSLSLYDFVVFALQASPDKLSHLRVKSMVLRCPPMGRATSFCNCYPHLMEDLHTFDVAFPSHSAHPEMITYARAFENMRATIQRMNLDVSDVASSSLWHDGCKSLSAHARRVIAHEIMQYSAFGIHSA